MLSQFRKIQLKPKWIWATWKLKKKYAKNKPNDIKYKLKIKALNELIPKMEFNVTFCKNSNREGERKRVRRSEKERKKRYNHLLNENEVFKINGNLTNTIRIWSCRCFCCCCCKSCFAICVIVSSQYWFISSWIATFNIEIKEEKKICKNSNSTTRCDAIVCMAVEFLIQCDVAAIQLIECRMSWFCWIEQRQCVRTRVELVEWLNYSNLMMNYCRVMIMKQCWAFEYD